MTFLPSSQSRSERMTLQEILDEIYLLVKDDGFFTLEDGETVPAATTFPVHPLPQTQLPAHSGNGILQS